MDLSLPLPNAPTNHVGNNVPVSDVLYTQMQMYIHRGVHMNQEHLKAFHL